MATRIPPCDVCADSSRLPRREFLKTLSAGAVSTAIGSAWLASPASRFVAAAESTEAAAATTSSENLAAELFKSLTDAQRSEICFPWDYSDDRGLLRLHVANNWQITDHAVVSDFFSSQQQELIEALFWKLYNPAWKERIQKQLVDDAQGYGLHQSIALFGEPGSGHFEFVMTGRHLTIRCDGDTAEHLAFGGPIFYGHAANEMFDEPATHPDNVFWEQALKANALFGMLDGRQRDQALVQRGIPESRVNFQPIAAERSGLLCSELSKDQQAHLEQVLSALVEPYRDVDQAEVRRCLAAQGGLEACKLTFYADADLGNDGVWDNWRLEGPAFVWHYRGNPHVHVWANVADDPAVRITTRG